MPDRIIAQRLSTIRSMIDEEHTPDEYRAAIRDLIQEVEARTIETHEWELAVTGQVDLSPAVLARLATEERALAMLEKPVTSFNERIYRTWMETTLGIRMTDQQYAMVQAFSQRDRQRHALAMIRVIEATDPSVLA